MRHNSLHLLSSLITSNPKLPLITDNRMRFPDLIVFDKKKKEERERETRVRMKQLRGIVYGKTFQLEGKMGPSTAYRS